MWPIFLKILSIIGIVLACILGVVIVLLLLILVCPVIYKVNGSAKDNNYTLDVKIKYLFGIVRAGYEYPEPGNIYAKAAWFTLYDSSSAEKAEDNSTDKSDKTSNNSNSDDEYENSEAEFEALDADIATDQVEENNTKNTTKSTKKKTTKKKKDTKNRKDTKKKIYNPIYYIKKTWENFRYKVIVKIQYIIKDIKYYYALWEHDDTQALVRKVKKHGLKILKIIAPKKGNVNLIFGADSPDTTGKIYGLCCAIFSRWPKTFNIIPDFENKVLEGTLYVKGHFNLFSLLIQALPIILSRKLKITKARFDAHGDKKDISKAKAEKKHNKILQELEEEYST